MVRIITFLLLSISHLAIAKGAVNSNKITKVAFQTGGFFMYATDWENPNNCTRSSAVVLKTSDSNYDKAYSLLLAAYMS